MRRNFDDGLATIFEVQPQCRIDLTAVKGDELAQLRRRARPFLHDSTERLPRDVEFAHRHAVRHIDCTAKPQDVKHEVLRRSLPGIAPTSATGRDDAKNLPARQLYLRLAGYRGPVDRISPRLSGTSTRQTVRTRDSSIRK